jgi:drug/metabolite transporter (DMT)-like permease
VVTAGRVAAPAILVPFAIVTLIWGSTWLVIRDQLAVVPANWSVSYRFALAGVLMVAIGLVRRDRFPADARGLALAAWLGLCQFFGNFNLVYLAEKHITSGLVAVVFALLLLPNAVLGRIVLGQRLSTRLLAGSVVAMAGVGLLILRQARFDPAGPHETLVGVSLTAGALLAASCANVAQGTKLARDYPMIPTVGVAMLMGAALDAVVALHVAGPPVIEHRPLYFAGLGYLAVFASALAFPLYYRVLRVIGTAKAAYSSVMVPVIAMALSTVFEGYRWSPLAGAGALLTAAGLVIALSARSPAR